MPYQLCIAARWTFVLPTDTVRMHAVPVKTHALPYKRGEFVLVQAAPLEAHRVPVFARVTSDAPSFVGCNQPRRVGSNIRIEKGVMENLTSGPYPGACIGRSSS